MEYEYLTIHKARELIQKRKLSPLELAKNCLSRVEYLDMKMNCFITLTADSALEQARHAEQALYHLDYLPMLHGIPLALKDLYETRNIRTTAGSKVFQDYVPDNDAEVVKRLKLAGVTLLGKLNMHEIALGVTNVNPHYGPCRNPWDLDRITGGSSGGSAASLMAGMCLGSWGSDTGGSIRIPSSLCGIVGLKPTYGRVSLSGVIPLSWNLDHAGPMARCVKDVAYLLQAVAGYDPGDPASINQTVPDYFQHLEDGIKGWRCAMAVDEFWHPLEPEIERAVNTAAQTFESIGVLVDRIDFPGGLEASRANSLMVTSDAAAYHQERLLNAPQYFGEDVLQRLQIGASHTSSAYVLARRTQQELKHKFDRFFENYHFLITPATPITAPRIEDQDALEQARLLTRFTGPFNLTGFPAISLPCGFTNQGLPIGLQIVTRPWAEADLLRVAFAYEQASKWFEQVPNIQYK